LTRWILGPKFLNCCTESLFGVVRGSPNIPHMKWIRLALSTFTIDVLNHPVRWIKEVLAYFWRWIWVYFHGGPELPGQVSLGTKFHHVGFKLTCRVVFSAKILRELAITYFTNWILVARIYI
jgi:hypothetical protein